VVKDTAKATVIRTPTIPPALLVCSGEVNAFLTVSYAGPLIPNRVTAR
jgi:hypothetical protein